MSRIAEARRRAKTGTARSRAAPGAGEARGAKSSEAWVCGSGEGVITGTPGWAAVVSTDTDRTRSARAGVHDAGLAAAPRIDGYREFCPRVNHSHVGPGSGGVRLLPGGL